MVEERALVLYFVSGIEMILIHPSRDFKQVTWSSGGCILQANTHTHTHRGLGLAGEIVEKRKL